VATWGDILNELKALHAKKHPAPFDYVRRRYLAELQQHTGRNIVLYASAWTQTLPDVPPEFVSMTEEDVQGFMEVFHGLPSDGLDLILHLPGGTAETTEAIVSYIRSKFGDVRVIVPHAAMSAATMLACSSQRVIMGSHSFLGPIDPQMILDTPLGRMAVPAQAILDQFETARQECEDPKGLAAWVPILPQYGPALLIQCTHALALSKELVSKWLMQYMFKGQSDAEAKAMSVANSLADHNWFKTHGRHINRDQARSFGVLVDDLEADQKLQDLVLSVFWAASHTFNGTPAVKLIENHLGRAYVKTLKVVAVPRVPPQQAGPPSVPPPPGPSP